MTRRSAPFLALLAAFALVAAACGGEEEEGPGAEGICATVDTEAGDLLARICEQGVLRVSTDPAYPPQSFLNEETGEYEGFDIDVATEIANRLGVRVEWEAPAWDTIVAGNWAGRWDVSVGSMTITPERAQVLYFTTPYYYTPAAIAVHRDNTTIAGPADLTGKRIGVCGACTYDFYLQGTLEIAQDPTGTPVLIESEIADPDIRTYDTDTTAITDLALGDGTRLDAVISALPTLQEAIDTGQPIKIVGEPLYYEPLSIAVDRASQLDATSLVEVLDDLVEQMHEDGTLTAYSMEWYGVDLTTLE